MTCPRTTAASVNFVTAHDGFTLRDLVSYNEKHNEANGEDNNDGESHNRSWNCGAEGPTENPEVQALRARHDPWCVRERPCAVDGCAAGFGDERRDGFEVLVEDDHEGAGGDEAQHFQFAFDEQPGGAWQQAGEVEDAGLLSVDYTESV